MTSEAFKLIDVSLPIAKSYISRVGRVCFTTPYMQTITESTYLSGEFDTFNDMIPAPDAAVGTAIGAAGVLTGTYSYYIQFWDNDRAVAGPESAQSVSRSPSSQQIDLDFTTITNESANSRATHYDVYRNQDGGSTYYFVTRQAIATTSYSDNNSDASIGSNDTLELDNDILTTQTYGITHAHKNFNFLAGPANGIGGTAYDHQYTWSKVNNPDVYPSVNATKIENGMHGQIRAVASMGDIVVFYKDDAIYELRFDTNPSGTTGNGSGVAVNRQRGALNHRCVVDVQGTHYVLDVEGIYQFSGGSNVQRLSEPLRGIWDRINWEEREKFSAAQNDESVMFAVALDGDTECRHVLVLDLNSIYLGTNPRWYKYSTDFGIRDLQTVNFGNDDHAKEMGMSFKRVATFITEYGEVGYIGAGYRDMVAPRLTASGTVTSSTTTTLTDTSAVFTRVNANSITENAVGAYVRFIVKPDADKPSSEDWDRPYRITAVTATQLTVSPAMPSAPAVGTEFVVGAVPDARIATPLLSFNEPTKGKVARHAVLEWDPTGENVTIGLEAHNDRTGAVPISEAVSDAEFTSTVGESQYAVNLGGKLSTQGAMGARSVPLPAEGFRYMQVYLDATGVDKPAIVNSIGVEIKNTES